MKHVLWTRILKRSACDLTPISNNLINLDLIANTEFLQGLGSGRRSGGELCRSGDSRARVRFSFFFSFSLNGYVSPPSHRALGSDTMIAARFRLPKIYIFVRPSPLPLAAIRWTAQHFDSGQEKGKIKDQGRSRAGKSPTIACIVHARRQRLQQVQLFEMEYIYSK